MKLQSADARFVAGTFLYSLAVFAIVAGFLGLFKLLGAWACAAAPVGVMAWAVFAEIKHRRWAKAEAA